MEGWKAHVQNKCKHVFCARGGYDYPPSEAAGFSVGTFVRYPISRGGGQNVPTTNCVKCFAKLDIYYILAIQREQSLVLNMS
jgi:hypothetical protein